ncbi:hypothetical protein L248_1213 [Schleiferilactobacillus shenzhenensis LY-73]|uniref:Uncharacterized protein n=1 Tax=Schleiferilactobacillus shenzhenensis LY-73 TaxID=1231336 RepID=U4TMK8_9LACO|nr:hypothetical protein L248_1213 [Schleiferilactobacillus shenzhenensis LY-73]
MIITERRAGQKAPGPEPVTGLDKRKKKPSRYRKRFLF